MIDARCKLTDDSILTMATADAICSKMDYAVCYHRWGNRHPHRGYGGSFRKWLATPEKDLAPYGSWGNGSAMRVSPVGFAFQTVDDVLDAVEASASATHNHEEGIRGVSATALAVFLAKQGQGKDAIKKEIEFCFGYDLFVSLDSIRPTYSFDVSCQGTVPVAIRAFLESSSYEDAIRNAVSVGAGGSLSRATVCAKRKQSLTQSSRPQKHAFDMRHRMMPRSLWRATLPTALEP